MHFIPQTATAAPFRPSIRLSNSFTIVKFFKKKTVELSAYAVRSFKFIGENLVGGNFRHLAKFSSVFPDEKFYLCFRSL